MEEPVKKIVKIIKDYACLLKGIARCGKCRSALVSTIAHSHTGKTFYYYECSRVRQKLGCDTKRISATAFDEAVIDFFRLAAKEKEIIVQTIENAIKDRSI